MVYYNQVAQDDLNDIFTGLAMWRKHHLNIEHIFIYVNDIRKECHWLDKKTIHIKAHHVFHKKFGKYIHRYKRNQHTTWHIIYNLDEYNNIRIEKIINNHFLQISH